MSQKKITSFLNIQNKRKEKKEKKSNKKCFSLEKLSFKHKGTSFSILFLKALMTIMDELIDW
jgi:hypothetical protein